MRTKKDLLRENERLGENVSELEKIVKELEQGIRDLATFYGFAASYELPDAYGALRTVDVDWILDDLEKIRDADDARLARERLGLDTEDEIK